MKQYCLNLTIICHFLGMCMQAKWWKVRHYSCRKKTGKIPTLHLIYISWIVSDKKMSFLMITLKGEGIKRACQFVISLITRFSVLPITFLLFLKLLKSSASKTLVLSIYSTASNLLLSIQFLLKLCASGWHACQFLI